MRFKNITITLLALFMVGSVMVEVGMAQSSGAHFQRKSVNAVLHTNGNLTVSWVEAGLGNFNVDYSLTGDVNATYFCRTNSGNIPNAANKHTENASATAHGSFEPKNGKVTASLTLAAPPAPSSEPPTCGNGQSLDLQSISWTNVVLSDLTYGIVFSFGKGSFTTTFYPAP